MRQNPNSMPFNGCCASCGMLRGECVCIQNITVNPPISARNEALSRLLRKKNCLRWDEIIEAYADFITGDKDDADFVREKYYGILKWLSENYHPPIKMKK